MKMTEIYNLEIEKRFAKWVEILFRNREEFNREQLQLALQCALEAANFDGYNDCDTR